MRYRSRIESFCPSIETIEWAYDRTTTPFTRVEVSRSPQDKPSSWYTWSYPASYRSFKEEMWDDTGTDGRFRPCLHTIETNHFDNVFVDHTFFWGWRGNAYLRSVGSSINDVSQAVALRTAPNIDMTAMANEACAYMLPRLNENTSLVNSLIELKDLKRMNPTGTVQRLRGRHLALKHLKDPVTRKRFVKETITRLNSAHLNAQFGIVPFVRDVVGIHDDLIGLAYRLKQLKRHAGKPQERHYKRVIPVSNGVPSDRDWRYSTRLAGWSSDLKFDNTPAGGSRSSITILRSARWSLRPTYHATMRYIYTLPSMDSVLEKVYAYLDVLGVRLDPSIVWNAIPFSFVVDWVVDVSTFLGSFARDNYPINTTVTDFCHSYAHRSDVVIECKYADLAQNPDYMPASWRVGPNLVPVYQGTRSYYNRVRFSPDIHTIRLKSPKLRQAALAGSLFLARTKWGRSYGYLNPKVTKVSSRKK